MFCDVPDAGGAYYLEPAGGVAVVTVGLDEEVSATTSNDQCDTWWEPGSNAECGEFEIEVPAGASLYLRTHEPNMGFIDGLGPVFTANADAFQVLVLVQEKLADTLMGAWDIDWSDGKGLVAGITAVIDPDGPTLFPEFVGGAQVTIAPLVEDPDYKFVYFDSKNPANTTLTATDPEQPLFFAANVPPRAASDPYHANVAHETYPFGDTAFVVEPGTLTYLPMSPKK